MLILRVTLVVVICIVGYKQGEVLVPVESGVTLSTFSSVPVFVNHPVPPH